MLRSVVLLSILLAGAESFITEDAEYEIDRECLIDDIFAEKLEPVNKLIAEVKDLIQKKTNCAHTKDIENLYDYYMWQFKALEKNGCKRHQTLDNYIAEFADCAREHKVARNNFLPHFAYEFHTCMKPAKTLYTFVR
uniref:Hypothetical secreted protein n=1 Tax=Simulium guianense TaxID=445764 RepID=F5GTS7_SIMGU